LENIFVYSILQKSPHGEVYVYPHYPINFSRIAPISANHQWHFDGILWFKSIF